MSNEQEKQACIKLCWDCRHQCQSDLYNYCLSEGGEHVAPDHVKIMTDCIQICQASADFMTRGSDIHAVVCGACAQVCRSCADSCAQIGMDECANICRQCADACEKMSQTAKRRDA